MKPTEKYDAVDVYRQLLHGSADAKTLAEFEVWWAAQPQAAGIADDITISVLFELYRPLYARAFLAAHLLAHVPNWQGPDREAYLSQAARAFQLEVVE